jgi:hypothetical protein
MLVLHIMTTAATAHQQQQQQQLGCASGKKIKSGVPA